MNNRVLITGAGAQLAGALVPEFTGTGEMLALRHAELDITVPAAVHRCVADFKPTLIIKGR